MKFVNSAVKTDNGEICGAVVESDSGEYVIETNNIVLAIGHSARDTFLMLQNRNIAMEQKSFSVGARIEHSQEMINKSQYGKAYMEEVYIRSVCVREAELLRLRRRTAVL